jgi:hypothetical protein
MDTSDLDQAIAALEAERAARLASVEQRQRTEAEVLRVERLRALQDAIADYNRVAYEQRARLENIFRAVPGTGVRRVSFDTDALWTNVSAWDHPDDLNEWRLCVPRYVSGLVPSITTIS